MLPRESAGAVEIPAGDADRAAPETAGSLDEGIEGGAAVTTTAVVGMDLQGQPGQVEVVALAHRVRREPDHLAIDHGEERDVRLEVPAPAVAAGQLRLRHGVLPRRIGLGDGVAHVGAVAKGRGVVGTELTELHAPRIPPMTRRNHRISSERDD